MKYELAGGAVLELERLTRVRVSQLGVDEAARAQVHSVALLALAPGRDADVADAHRLSDLRAQPAWSRAHRPARRRRGSPATSRRSTLEAGRSKPRSPVHSTRWAA